MATEGLQIDSTSEDAANVALDLNDLTSTFLISATYPTPELDQMFSSSVDTEGDPLVQNRYKNRQITLVVRVQGSSLANLQQTLGYIELKCGKINREGGTLKRTAPSTSTIVFDLNSATADIPTDKRALVRFICDVTITFNAKPFGRGAAVTASDHTETTLPHIIFTETAIPGDVPALGRLVIDEDQGNSQAAALWGVQSRYYDSASSAALFFPAEGLTLQGAGAATSTAATGYSGTGSVLANTLSTSYQSILSSQATGPGAHWSHVGEYRVFARVQAPSDGTVTLRAQWTVGDGRVWTANDETRIDTQGQWVLIDLGPVNIPKAVAGTQRWELRVHGKSTVVADDVYIDSIYLFPITEGFGITSALPPSIDYSAFQARDEFDQAGGALAGKTPNTGGNWAGTGDADDFSTTGSGTITRVAVSDTSTSLGNARLETMATPSSLAALNAQLTFYPGAISNASGEALKQGMLLRYVDSSNFLAVYGLMSHDDYGEHLRLVIVERIAGTDTALFTADANPAYSASTAITLYANVGSDGTCYAGVNGVELGSVSSVNLATGGTLASGKVGILDHYTAAPACTRTYTYFGVYGAIQDAAVFASQSMEIRNNMVIREDSGGTLWQPVSKYEGDYLLVPVAGREARTTRFIVKLSRGVVETGIDNGIDDLSARLTYTPRYLVVPE